jgi:hypothetical protein
MALYDMREKGWVWWGGGESVVDSGESAVVEKYWDACSGGGAEKDGIDDGCGGVVTGVVWRVWWLCGRTCS